MMLQEVWHEARSFARQCVQALPLLMGGVRAVRRARRPHRIAGALSTADVEHVRRDPWKVFRTPKEVVNHGALSSEDKKQILETWEQDAKQLAIAESEGMSGGEPNRLSEVSDAKQQVAEREGDRFPSNAQERNQEG
jgi:hypothetical protein